MSSTQQSCFPLVVDSTHPWVGMLVVAGEPLRRGLAHRWVACSPWAVDAHLRKVRALPSRSLIERSLVRRVLLRRALLSVLLELLL